MDMVGTPRCGVRNAVVDGTCFHGLGSFVRNELPYRWVSRVAPGLRSKTFALLLLATGGHATT